MSIILVYDYVIKYPPNILKGPQFGLKQYDTKTRGQIDKLKIMKESGWSKL